MSPLSLRRIINNMQQIGKYKIIKELGAGGFGAVYLAEDPRLHTQVAIKVFQVRDENLAGQATSSSTDAVGVLKQRFIDEARTLRKLSVNPYIVEMYEFDELEDGTPYYVMPYLSQSIVNEIGKDAFSQGALEDLPAELHPRRIPTAKALMYLKQLLEALSAVHQQSLIHRDIKPANLLLNSQGQLQLCDFGIAKLPDAEYSQSGVGMGSRNYMSPEQRESAKHVTYSSDIYSVGILAYRMLTGQLPAGRFQDPIHYAPDIGESLNKLILQSIEQKPQDRYSDASAMLIALTQAQKEQGKTQDEDDATGTWIDAGNNTSNIKAELKPLQNKIIELLHTQGEIKDTDQTVLLALAAIGDLDEVGLNTLIVQVTDEQANSQPQQKAFQQWVVGVNTRLHANHGKLSKKDTEALMQAGQSSTGKTAQQLHGLIQAKTTHDSSSTSSSTQASTQKKGGVGKAFVYATLLILLGVGGYFGYDYYQQQQTKQRLAAQAKQHVEKKRQQQLVAEKQAWEKAKTQNTIDSYQVYIQAWPKGKNIKVAQSNLDNLQEQVRVAKLSVQDRQTALTKKTQGLLVKLGYQVPQTGQVDTRTQKAIEAFEQSEGMLVTGSVDNILLEGLSKAHDRIDNAAWTKAQNTHSSQGYQRYLDDFPEGLHASKANTLYKSTQQAEQLALARKKAQEQDTTAWQMAKKQNSIKAYQAYLNQQTKGQYRQQAQQQIKNIELDNSKVALTITTTPDKATIQLIDIAPKYKDGIRLLPGEYQIKISKQGYHSRQETLTLDSSNQRFSYQLKKDIPKAILALIRDMQAIPAGSFKMGSKNGEANEMPLHLVNIKAFRLMQTEVTKGMFAAFVEDTGYKTEAERNTGYKKGCYSFEFGTEKHWTWTEGVTWKNVTVDGYRQKDNHPVVCVSWNDVSKFIDWLNMQTGEVFRLPSEAEWEYAASAGSQDAYSFGNDASQLCAHANVADKTQTSNGDTWTAAAECTDEYLFTAPVRHYRANAFGLYDMHGNVLEWVQDCFNDSYHNAPTNGDAWMSGNCRFAQLRGGSWNDGPAKLRSTFRGMDLRVSRITFAGFRLAQDR
ncbi:bifunctional serine/threonine-protein kinase/formylglycine-generating enzyme family protein [uncultured Paraglaciecola sp.]|uniref:bifunctional serine/threonine-protein kinase/formylglycine-generating enzyme family protein n=1 Tax=uncultured Paraglaciecola sp. TaxID=1765024 RepID=UPI002628DC70|nr:bifunctional serine/threonine-protein kinase/formylglycine-generating enzyme family protein [uncultured Paraglaciecola sp.]